MRNSTSSGEGPEVMHWQLKGYSMINGARLQGFSRRAVRVAAAKNLPL
ncbi:MAG: hypothetical protein PHO08_06305 [Methylococcales bacterium]|nr:hypothetical protein [Methylococcales bacterium]MDD5632543.1 hypothetical protein [Methylococcales bacterium]